MRTSSRLLFVSFITLLVLAASASASEAQIVYTPANVTITDDGTLPIDLNNDGVSDVTLNQAFDYSGCYYAYEAAYPAKNNGVVSGSSSLDGPLANALPQGVLIGSGQPFNTFGILTDESGGFGCPFSHDYGYWQNAGPHYLGIFFVKNGKIRYGWAELNVTVVIARFAAKMTTTLMGYAYQTIPGKAIPAGKM